MRSLNRNKQKIYYALYRGKTEVIDENGLRTGNFPPEYSSPQPLSINVSAQRGTPTVEMFGIDTDYSRTMQTNDLKCPIDETSVLWVGKEPNEAGSDFNYRVVAVARSINSITYAIQEVKR